MAVDALPKAQTVPLPIYFVDVPERLTNIVNMLPKSCAVDRLDGQERSCLDVMLRW